MLQYVYGQDQIMSQFAASLIQHCRRGFGPNIKTFGVVDDGDGSLIAAVIFHNWDPDAGLMEISGAALPGAPWITRETLRRIYQFPFLQCGCQMVVQRVPADNETLLYVFARYGYDLVKVPRLFGRDRDGVLGLLTREAWESNKFNTRLKHHLEAPIREAA